MNATDLNTLLSSGNPPTLIHVLPPEQFQREHIRGSLNACVFEVVFVSTVANLVPDPSQSIVVYGAGNGSLDAQVAKSKLVEAGFTSVATFDAGISGWKSAGFSVAGDPSETSPETFDSVFHVNCAQSLIRWTGRNLLNHHSGTLRLQSGTIVISSGNLVESRFEIDMESIECEDIPDQATNAILIAHLKNADFFDTAHFPTATFEAHEAGPIPGSTDGRPNFQLNGTLSLRGTTKPVSFPIVVAVGEVNQLVGQATFDLDRTEFGSIYGSGRFFQFLGKHVVNDHIHLLLKIHATRSA